MIRLILSVILIVSIFIYALLYTQSYLLKSNENSVSLAEMGKIMNDLKKNNSDRKRSIKENEKLVEDLNENN